MSLPYLKIFGARLAEHGYRIVCITPGSKASHDDGWQTSNASIAQIKKWTANGRANHGVGIITEQTPAVDIDCFDAALVEELIAWIHAEYGDAPVRVGNAPKSLLLFKAPVPFTKVMSASWIAPDAPTILGKPSRYRLEVLGRGQQFVAFATHPDTKKAYAWTSGTSPMTMEAQDLPVLTAAAAQRIADKFDQLAKAKGWTIAGAARVPAASDEWDANLASRTNLTIEQARETLMSIPNTDATSLDYDKWLEYGMACYHQFEGAIEGYDLWVEWSEQSFKFNINECEKKWKSFDEAGKDRVPVTFRSVLADAKQFKEASLAEKLAEIKNGFRDAKTHDEWKKLIQRIKTTEFDPTLRMTLIEPAQKSYLSIHGANISRPDVKKLIRQEVTFDGIPEWLEGWVFDDSNSQFVFPAKGQRTSAVDFDVQFGRYFLTPAELREGKATPDVRPAHAALNLIKIPRVDGSRYAPLDPPMLFRENKKFVNSYSELNVPPVPATWMPRHQRAADIFFAHIAHLFPDQRDQGIVLSWFAYIVQTRSRVHWALVIQGCEGDGKSVLHDIMSAVLGRDNTKIVNTKSFASEFNRFAEGSLLSCVDEIRVSGDNRFAVMDRIKVLITNDHIAIRPLYQEAYTAENTTSYLLLTNHQDAVPVTDETSRYYILKTQWTLKAKIDAFKAENPDYYFNLWSLVNEGGAIRKALLEYELHPEFNAGGRAPPSRGRAYMTSITESDEYAALRDILDRGDNRLVCPYFISAHEAIEAIEREAGIRLTPSQIRWLLQSNGFTLLGRLRFMLKGQANTHGVWTLTPEAWPEPRSPVFQSQARRYFLDDEV